MSAHSSPARVVTASLPKREAILGAALEVFAEHGVHGVAVFEIAERAQVGTGTIYRVFDSKDSLVNELYREKKRALGRRLVGLDPNLAPRALFDEFWRRVVAFAREEPDAFRFLEMQDHLAYLDPKSRDLERRVLSPVTSACRALQKRGVFRKELRAEVIIALHWGAMVNLFKAERHGYLTIKQRDLVAACDACWRMCVCD